MVDRRYEVEERVTVDAERGSTAHARDRAWALNEASLETSATASACSRSRSPSTARPLLRFGCDGVLCATPTGSTAYAFSAGGPIVWPNVDALLVVPNAAHALFARPIVVAPESRVDIDLLRPEHPACSAATAAARSTCRLAPGAGFAAARVPIRIVRLADWSFADRLVDQVPAAGVRFPQRPGGTRTR